MTKLKNPNILLSLIFSLISIILSFMDLSQVILKYPASFSGSALFLLCLLTLAAGIFVFSGILCERRALIISGIGALAGESLLYAFFYIYITSRFIPSGYEILNFVFLIIPVISYILLLFYITDVVKDKKLIASFLVVSFMLSLLSSYFFFGFSGVFLLSSFGLLLYYVNLTDAASKINTGEVLFLSLLTFGIFYVYWTFSSVRKVKMITKDTSSFFPEILFLILFPLYASYWFYTRYEDLSENSPRIKNRGVLCMVLSIFFLCPLSLAILQRDLNKISDEFSLETNILNSDKALSENDSF